MRNPKNKFLLSVHGDSRFASRPPCTRAFPPGLNPLMKAESLSCHYEVLVLHQVRPFDRCPLEVLLMNPCRFLDGTSLDPLKLLTV